MVISLHSLLVSLETGSKNFCFSVRVEKSFLNCSILKVLVKKGYIYNYEYKKTSKFIKVFLRYVNGEPIIKKIFQISKPGSRIYVTIKQLTKKYKKYSFVLLSTTHGLLTYEEAIKKNVSGELLFYLI